MHTHTHTHTQTDAASEIREKGNEFFKNKQYLVALHKYAKARRFVFFVLLEFFIGRREGCLRFSTCKHTHTHTHTHVCPISGMRLRVSADVCEP